METEMKKFFTAYAIVSLFFLISCGSSPKNEEQPDSGGPQNGEDTSDTEVPDDPDTPGPSGNDTDTAPEQNDDDADTGSTGDTDDSDDADDAPDGGDTTPDDEPENVTDLSKSGTANCYIIKTAGDYSFDATSRGNGKKAEGVDFTEEKLNPADVRLVWQSNKDGLIDSLSLKDGRIYFSAKNLGGNALVAALDEAGNIIWSWHIWLLNEDIADVKTRKGALIMDRNLGATSLDPESPESHGLLYQWGRKDPFPASPIVSGGTTSTMPVPVYDAEGNEVEIAHSSWENSDV